MKVKPILFNGPMIRALLDGRKTQTRRIIKPQPKGIDDMDSGTVCLAWQDGFVDVNCPYGKVGDRLWVRETHTFETNQLISDPSYTPPHNDGRPVLWTDCPEWGRFWTQPHYRATDEELELDYDGDGPECRWTPSIHMRRWASRITLEITDIRVERLQDISEEDALSEGVLCPTTGTEFEAPVSADYKSGPKTWFAMLWSKINGIDSWRENPWVWVVEFKVHKCNVDKLLENT